MNGKSTRKIYLLTYLAIPAVVLLIIYAYTLNNSTIETKSSHDQTKRTIGSSPTRMDGAIKFLSGLFNSNPILSDTGDNINLDCEAIAAMKSKFSDNIFFQEVEKPIEVQILREEISKNYNSLEDKVENDTATFAEKKKYYELSIILLQDHYDLMKYFIENMKSDHVKEFMKKERNDNDLLQNSAPAEYSEELKQNITDEDMRPLYAGLEQLQTNIDNYKNKLLNLVDYSGKNRKSRYLFEN
jgi:hypothetical protein